jgi:branched-chain amino acid transport system ATP-binding protein
LFGQDITHLPSHARARRRLGRTYQITNVFPALCVEDNVLLAALGTSRPWMKLQPLRTVPRRGPLRDRVERALLDVGLQDRAAAVVRELSHGEQRQLELALALAGEPRVLMLDEPAAGLSAAERVRMSELIRGLSPELTLVIIEHDMDLVLNLVDRVTCLHNGRVVAEATPASIRQDATIQSIYLGVGQAC